MSANTSCVTKRNCMAQVGLYGPLLMGLYGHGNPIGYNVISENVTLTRNALISAIGTITTVMSAN